MGYTHKLHSNLFLKIQKKNKKSKTCKYRANYFLSFRPKNKQFVDEYSTFVDKLEIFLKNTLGSLFYTLYLHQFKRQFKLISK